ncbi:cation transporter/ATPase, family protein [Clostridium botulinum 202F]|nr:cation-transporting P-type ATPase [Clostridium sp. ZBS20]AIY78954.1 cation transporter/ATPase, family protein [Clostridium botulinum 202F]KAI3348741.1 cation-transporting P-type ATPase [Clostridium botulinum]
MNYIKELQKLYVELNTNPDKGLGTEQVKEARKKYGENRFKEKNI